MHIISVEFLGHSLKIVFLFIFFYFQSLGIMKIKLVYIDFYGIFG